MSLFGSLMGGFDEDPFYGSASGMMRQMDSMMSSMMRGDPFGAAGDPFGSMMGGHLMGTMSHPHQRQQHLPIMNGGMGNMHAGMGNMNALDIMANPMSMMNNIMANMDHMRGESNTQMYSSSSVMSMTMGPDGKPQVYQASSSSRGGPGGVRETQHSVVDSSSGTRKLAIGHHIGDRARIVEREQNAEGDEEKEELLNLDETEADAFEREFRRVAGGSRAALEAGGHAASSNRRAAAPLAIEAPPTSARPSADRHVGVSERSTGAASDRYTLERVPIGRSSGIDTSKFERRAAHDRSGLDRYDYHHPNMSYTPAPTSYTRPSSYLPSMSSRSYRVSTLNRPLSSYTGPYRTSGRGAAGGGGRAAHQHKSHRRASPYDQ